MKTRSEANGGLTFDELRRRLPGFIARDRSSRLRIRGDHDLNPDMPPPDRTRPAAVLVPLIEREQGLTVLFTQRTDTLAAHAGQISFPGGACEGRDPDPLSTALRETEEEIGITARQIVPLGRLDTYVTRTGFRVEPFVGSLSPPIDLRLNQEEVAEAFEVPLSFILAPGNPVRQSIEVAGRRRFYYVFPYRDRFIWGATAGMLNNLIEVLAD